MERAALMSETDSGKLAFLHLLAQALNASPVDKQQEAASAAQKQNTCFFCTFAPLYHPPLFYNILILIDVISHSRLHTVTQQ